MSESTFLGTPLSKHDIDDIEIQAKSKRARTYLESKELKHRQNRELIKRNKLKTLYTVDTEEGWIPSEFKTSRTKRATYNFQTLSNFTDQDDSDIVSLNLLNSLKIKEREIEINRIIKGILNIEGFLNRVYGPQLPPDPNYYTHLREPGDLRGVGFTETLEHDSNDNLEMYDTSDNHKVEDEGIDEPVTKLKWISVDGNLDKEVFPRVIMDLGVKKEDLKKFHKYDRDIDLADIKRYYKNYYEYIVKPIEDSKEETVQDLLEKYTKMPEFTKMETPDSGSETLNVKYKDSQNTKESKEKYPNNFKGRSVSKYDYCKEILSKFKIKTQEREPIPTTPTAPVTNTPEEDDQPLDLPFEMFYNLFGKRD